MPRKKIPKAQMSYLENYGMTAPAVPAIQEAVREWAARGYKGATNTSQALLNFWFHTDHKLPAGSFSYYDAQRQAIETLIYIYEVAQTRTMADLYQRFIPADLVRSVRMESLEPLARYCIKMATGSGKTKVMTLAIAWQYFNSVLENDPTYARTFLIIAPNVIVFERLRLDFAGGRIFRIDPIIPKEMQTYWDVQFYMRGEAERASSQGAVYLTNIQQLYENGKGEDDELDIMTVVLGPKPPANMTAELDFRQRILARSDCPFAVLNDEAHHTHDPESEWNRSIRSLREAHPGGLSMQLDFSATPRYSSGALFAWTVSDYTLKQALVDRIVKRPVKGITDIGEVTSKVPEIRYQPFITAAVERWREYRDLLVKMGKKPILFVMMNNTSEADVIGHYLRVKYPDEFGGDKTLVIHTDRKGEVSKKDLDTARMAAREVDYDTNPINAIVSVLMLREGWDVQNVTVIVGLRPYTAKANILPEQTIGRGLRLMFRGMRTPYLERVDVIGNPGFIKFVEQLEKEEDFQFDTWQVGKERLVITVIEPDPDKAEYDIALPELSPILTRSTSIREEIEAIDVMAIDCPPLPRKGDAAAERTFHYQGMDVLTLETLFERTYTIPTPQTSQEVISYYAQAIAQELKLPSHFAVLAPKVRDFLKYRAFGEEVDLDTPDILQSISRRLTLVVTMKIFVDLLRDSLILPQTPVLENEGRWLSSVGAFPWSQDAPVCGKTVFNKVPCDNQFEVDFAHFLDNASDVARFGKLPMKFGFTIPYTDTAGNLRHYYPDFVVVDYEGVHYLVETKGREDIDVANKDHSAAVWADSATQLTGIQWEYVKILQRDFQALEPVQFADCAYMGRIQPDFFDNTDSQS
jgi:type III restriction enzyme